jgi:hypothetical protein
LQDWEIWNIRDMRFSWRWLWRLLYYGMWHYGIL